MPLQVQNGHESQPASLIHCRYLHLRKQDQGGTLNCYYCYMSSWLFSLCPLTTCTFLYIMYIDRHFSCSEIEVRNKLEQYQGYIEYIWLPEDICSLSIAELPYYLIHSYFDFKDTLKEIVSERSSLHNTLYTCISFYEPEHNIAVRLALIDALSVQAFLNNLKVQLGEGVSQQVWWWIVLCCPLYVSLLLSKLLSIVNYVFFCNFWNHGRPSRILC